LLLRGLRCVFGNIPAMNLIDLPLLKARLQSLDGRFDVDVVASCDSTNSALLRQAEAGAPSGRVLVAEVQTAGRGRRGRHWVSASADSLTFSLLWRFPLPINRLSGLSLAVGVAVSRALEALGAVGVCLKWPNDILLRQADGDAKLAGILIELQADRRGVCTVIGIGLNLRLPGDEVPQPAAGLAQAMSQLPGRTELLAELLRQLALTLDAFAVDGLPSCKTDWLARHAWQDAPVTLLDAEQPPRHGLCRGVDDEGALLLETASGLERILSGDVSLRRA